LVAQKTKGLKALLGHERDHNTPISDDLAHRLDITLSQLQKGQGIIQSLLHDLMRCQVGEANMHKGLLKMINYYMVIHG
jgi:hypothetical protein